VKILQNPHFCPKCDQYLSNRPLTVDAVIIKQSQVLLILRSGYPYKNYWALPGGFVDRNETLENALIRETKEETGLKIIKYHLLGIYSNPKRHPKQLIAASFSVKVKGIPKAGDDAKKCSFFPIHKLPLKIAFDHRQMIKDALIHE
jgi:8-oxo-dGTP diphosphatase